MSERSSDAAERFAAIARALAGRDGVQVGQGARKGFGSSALQVEGKIFALVSSRDELVLKLPRARVDELVASGAGHRFDPGHGRIMKEWLALDPRAEPDWLALGREARDYVARGR